MHLMLIYIHTHIHTYLNIQIFKYAHFLSTMDTTCFVFCFIITSFPFITDAVGCGDWDLVGGFVGEGAPGDKYKTRNGNNGCVRIIRPGHY